MRRQTKLRKRLQLRQKKLSRAVQLAVLSMSLTPSTVLADVQIEFGPIKRQLTESMVGGCEFYLADGRVQWRSIGDDGDYPMKGEN